MLAHCLCGYSCLSVEVSTVIALLMHAHSLTWGWGIQMRVRRNRVMLTHCMHGYLSLSMEVSTTAALLMHAHSLAWGGARRRE